MSNQYEENLKKDFHGEEHIQVDELSLEELNAIFGGVPQTAVQDFVKLNKENHEKKSLEYYLDEDIHEESNEAPRMGR